MGERVNMISPSPTSPFTTQAMLTDTETGAGGGSQHNGGGASAGGGGGAFSFLWGTEKSGFMHLELHTFFPASGKGQGPLIGFVKVCVRGCVLKCPGSWHADDNPNTHPT